MNIILLLSFIFPNFLNAETYIEFTPAIQMFEQQKAVYLFSDLFFYYKKKQFTGALRVPLRFTIYSKNSDQSCFRSSEYNETGDYFKILDRLEIDLKKSVGIYFLMGNITGFSSWFHGAIVDYSNRLDIDRAGTGVIFQYKHRNLVSRFVFADVFHPDLMSTDFIFTPFKHYLHSLLKSLYFNILWAADVTAPKTINNSIFLNFFGLESGLKLYSIKHFFIKPAISVGVLDFSGLGASAGIQFDYASKNTILEADLQYRYKTAKFLFDYFNTAYPYHRNTFNKNMTKYAFVKTIATGEHGFFLRFALALFHSFKVDVLWGDFQGDFNTDFALKLQILKFRNISFAFACYWQDIKNMSRFFYFNDTFYALDLRYALYKKISLKFFAATYLLNKIREDTISAGLGIGGYF